MKHRLYESIRRIADAVSRHASERLFYADMKRRREENGWFVGVVLLIALSAPACVPRHVERSIASELRRCEAAINAAPPSEAEAIGRQCHARIEGIDP